VLDYPIARLDVSQALLDEEAALNVQFADSLARPYALTLAPRELRRLAAEVDLADVVVVGSQYAAESFQGIVEPERLAVVPYGVDTSMFSPRSCERPEGPLRVLFAGHVSLRKGIVYVLEAMKQLDPSRFELTLVGRLLGKGDGLRRYHGRFRHQGGVRPQEMPEVYRQADVLVLPSLVEGSALVVLEAMASGMPVIVTPNVGADAVRDGVEGFVVPIRSAEQIADRLARFAADPALLRAMGQAARKRALEYDWSNFHVAFQQVVVGFAKGELSGLAVGALR
jgi:glycosyltransferase involved in cell wall biosynthesis